MIVALKPGVTQESREQLMDWLQNLGLHIHVSEGEYQTILGLVGDTTKVDMDLVASLDIVDSVKRVTEPFKCCNRKFHPEDTVVQVGDATRISGRSNGKINVQLILERMGGGGRFDAAAAELKTAVLTEALNRIPKFSRKKFCAYFRLSTISRVSF